VQDNHPRPQRRARRRAAASGIGRSELVRSSDGFEADDVN
jgi:hypothetical protein